MTDLQRTVVINKNVIIIIIIIMNKDGIKGSLSKLIIIIYNKFVEEYF